MDDPPSPRPYDEIYDFTLNIIKEHGLELGAKFAALSVADPAIPPYYYIKNCILVARARVGSDIHEIYRLRAEQKYDSSLREAVTRPDDDTLQALRELRLELDQLYACRVAAVSVPPLPSLLLGWLAYLDVGSGRCYYYNLSTLTIQWEFPCSAEMARGAERKVGEAMVSGVGDEVEVEYEYEYEMDEEDEEDGEDDDYEEEDKDKDGDCEEGNDNKDRNDDAEALPQPIQPANESESSDQDKSSSLTAELVLRTGKPYISSSST